MTCLVAESESQPGLASVCEQLCAGQRRHSLAAIMSANGLCRNCTSFATAFKLPAAQKLCHLASSESEQSCVAVRYGGCGCRSRTQRLDSVASCPKERQRDRQHIRRERERARASDRVRRFGSQANLVCTSH